MRPRLRRIALAAQGLNTREPFGRGKQATARAVSHLGYVQIDTISVVERAHHHVLRTRVPNYQPNMLNKLLQAGELFEYWYHAAAYLPMHDYRYALPRMRTYRDGTARWMRSRDRKLVAECLARIRDDGPLKSRDFEDPREKAGTWWDWKPAKQALEQAFMQGDLLITNRQGFQKTYDLTERALPDHVDTAVPTEEEFATYLVDTTLRAHGFAHLKSFAHLRRGQSVRKAIQAVLDRYVADGEVTYFQTSDGHRYYARTALLDSRAPAARRDQARILSPFDNAVILRDRLNALFDFDYTIECYVPEAKRQYGYFCLPILVGDQFIGRVDAKAHRKEARLELKHLHLDRSLDDKDLNALGEALNAFAEFNGCEHISLSKLTPASYRKQLKQMGNLI